MTVTKKVECTTGSCPTHKEVKKTAPFGKRIANTLHYAYIETIGGIATHFLIGLIIATSNYNVPAN